jgi:BASS family bile acid:Na+ symporter
VQTVSALLIAFKILLGAAVALAAFGTGLQTARVERLWPYCSPGLFWRSLLSVLVLVPLAAILLVEALRPDVVVRAGLVVSIFAVGVGPLDEIKRARAASPVLAYELGLDITLLIASVAFIPVAVALHGLVFHHHVHLAIARVALVVLANALAPMAVGLLVARLAPRRADQLGRHAARISATALLAALPVALLAIGPKLASVGAAGWATSALVATVAVVIGHALGGPDPATRAVLAAHSTIRFPPLALLIAAAAHAEKRLLPVVLAYIIASSVAVAGYTIFTKALARGRGQRLRHA